MPGEKHAICSLDLPIYYFRYQAAILNGCLLQRLADNETKIPVTFSCLTENNVLQ